MKKFNILIIDDEGNNSSLRIGWRRVIEFLKNNNFIVSESNSFYPNKWEADEMGELKYSAVNNLQINYSVMSLETQFWFYQIVNSIATWKSWFDIIFIDLNYERDFLNEAEKKCDIKIVNDIEISDLKKGEIPQYLAGLYILNKLPHTTKIKKVIFSAAIKARDFIGYANMLSSRFDDISILRYDEMENLVPELEQFLAMKQLAICSNFSEDIILAVENCLQLKEYEKECIPDINGSWTLSSLFPKHINEFISLPDKKKSISEIKNFIANYPKHLSHLANAPHAEAKEGWTSQKIDIYQNDILVLNKKEFQKDKAKNSIRFLPITSFTKLGPLKSEKEKIQQILKIRDTICEPENSKQWKFDELAGLNVSEHDIRTWLKDYGFYPGYLKYILEIIKNNAARKGQDMIATFEIKQDKLPENNVLTFDISVCNGSEITLYDLHRAKANGKDAKPDNCFFGDKSEGIEDIVKIICFRYRGVFEFACQSGFIIFKAEGQEIEDPQIIGDLNHDLAYNSGLFKITIPLIK